VNRNVLTLDLISYCGLFERELIIPARDGAFGLLTRPGDGERGAHARILLKGNWRRRAWRENR